VTISTLGGLKDEDVDMFSTVIIGNSQSYVSNGRIVTPRGYRLEV
jgi:precorrin-3B C17-methyltransferase